MSFKEYIKEKHFDIIMYYDKFDEIVDSCLNSIKELDFFVDILKEIKMYAMTAVNEDDKKHIYEIYKKAVSSIIWYTKENKMLASNGIFGNDFSNIDNKLNSVKNILNQKISKYKLSIGTNSNISPDKYRIIRNEELRTELLKIIDETEKSLYICSPWMSVSRLYNQDKIISRMERMLNDGIELKILYGYQDNENNNVEARKYLDSKFKLFSNSYKIKHTNTHSKILISDKRKCWVGSCNLLSFGADYSNGHTRDEMMLEIIDEKLAKLYIDKEFDF